MRCPSLRPPSPWGEGQGEGEFSSNLNRNPNPNLTRAHHAALMNSPFRHSPFGFLSSFVIRHSSFPLLLFLLSTLDPRPSTQAATVTGTLQDISIQPLDTK